MVSHLPTCFISRKFIILLPTTAKTVICSTQLNVFRASGHELKIPVMQKLSSRKRHIFVHRYNCLVTSTVRIVYIFYHVDYRQQILIHIQCEPMASTSFVCFPLMSQRSLCVSWARSHRTTKNYLFIYYTNETL